MSDTDTCDGCGLPVDRHQTIIAARGAIWHRDCAPQELVDWPAPRGTTHTELHMMHLEAEKDTP
jgi:hypothetical protein